MREALFALILVTAAALVVAGVAMVYVPAAYVTAGVLVAGIGYLFLVEAG